LVLRQALNAAFKPDNRSPYGRSMTSETNSGAETGFDRLLHFTLPDRNARGRIVRLGPALEDILAAHPYPPALKHLLSEALVLTALMGALLKDEASQLTLQAQADDGIDRWNGFGREVWVESLEVVDGAYGPELEVTGFDGRGRRIPLIHEGAWRM